MGKANDPIKSRVTQAIQEALADAFPPVQGVDALDRRDGLEALADRVQYLADILLDHVERGRGLEPMTHEQRFLLGLVDLLDLAVRDARSNANIQKL